MLKKRPRRRRRLMGKTTVQNSKMTTEMMKVNRRTNRPLANEQAKFNRDTGPSILKKAKKTRK